MILLECILKDVTISDDDTVRGDISALLLRLLDKTVRSTNELGDRETPVFDLIRDSGKILRYYHCLLLQMKSGIITNMRNKV